MFDFVCHKWPISSFLLSRKVRQPFGYHAEYSSQNTHYPNGIAPFLFWVDPFLKPIMNRGKVYVNLELGPIIKECAHHW